MRNIGTLPTADDARRFGDALYLRGVENDVEEEDDGTFSIWVHDDTQLDAARSLLAEFRADPQAGAFSQSGAEAARARAKAEKEDRQRASNIITRERIDYERNYHATTWLPILLIIACVAVFIQTSDFGGQDSETGKRRSPISFLTGGGARYGEGWLKYLHIQYPPLPHLENMSDQTMERLLLTGKLDLASLTDPTSVKNLTNIRDGQVWRLVTPIFIHYGFLHIIFNMMWLRSLGSFLENRFGTLYLALFIVATAALSNFCQYLVSGPGMGGMSGVNYALFGFLWLRGKYDRHSFSPIPPVIVQMMIMWFFVCLFGLMGNVANTAHFVGLAAGAAWGYLTARLASRRRTNGPA